VPNVLHPLYLVQKPFKTAISCANEQAQNELQGTVASFFSIRGTAPASTSINAYGFFY
jgi:hypothetical protein